METHLIMITNYCYILPQLPGSTTSRSYHNSTTRVISRTYLPPVTMSGRCVYLVPLCPRAQLVPGILGPVSLLLQVLQPTYRLWTCDTYVLKMVGGQCPQQSGSCVNASFSDGNDQPMTNAATATCDRNCKIEPVPISIATINRQWQNNKSNWQQQLQQ